MWPIQWTLNKRIEGLRVEWTFWYCLNIRQHVMLFGSSVKWEIVTIVAIVVINKQFIIIASIIINVSTAHTLKSVEYIFLFYLKNAWQSPINVWKRIMEINWFGSNPFCVLFFFFLLLLLSFETKCNRKANLKWVLNEIHLTHVWVQKHWSRQLVTIYR